MDYASIICEERRNQGLTQSELAYRSRVSLPTIQNIETGKANPTVSTLTAVLGVLGLELVMEPRRADWTLLARCGAPLMVREEMVCDGGQAGAEPYVDDTAPVPPTADELLRGIRDACRELRDMSDSESSERRREAVQALILALQIHFPTVFNRHLAGGELYREFISAPITGRIIRAVRETVPVLASYL